MNECLFSEDCRIVNKVMDEMEMTTEIRPMSTNVFTTTTHAPPPPPPPPPHTPPTTDDAHTDADAPPTVPTPSSSPVKTQRLNLKLNKRKRKRQRSTDEEDDCPPPPAAKENKTTLTCTNAFPQEIARYVEYLRPGWDRHFSDGVVTLLLFTAYRYANQNKEAKWKTWRNTMVDVTELCNDTYLHAAEHVKKYCECAMKVILMHASMTAVQSIKIQATNS